MEENWGFQEDNGFTQGGITGRNKEPPAGIIDSQSVKITDKGGLMVMMLSRK